MTWTDRMKKTIETFKRMALPLYGFYILFTIIGIIVAAISVGATLLPFIRMNGFNPSLSAVPYMDPNVPVPPGYEPSINYGYGYGYDFLNELAPYLDMAPTILLSVAFLMLAGWLLASFFLTGVFHLTRKAYIEKAQFRDIRLKGFLRIVGWYGVIGIIGTFLIGLGVLIAFTFRSEYAMAFFGLGYALTLFALGIFLAPWVSAAPYTMLNRPHLPFGKAFKESWRFYRRHMGPLWGAFLTVLGVQLLISFINRSAPDIGLLITFITSPFVAILPIVWVFTLEEEEQPVPIATLYTSPSESTPATNMNYPPSPPNRDYATSEPARPTPPSNPSTPPSNPGNPSDKPYTPPRDLHLSPDELASPPSHIYVPPTDPYTDPDTDPDTDPYTDSSYTSPNTPLTSPTDSHDSPMNFCPTCGKKVREGASYCSQCGTKL